MVINYHIYINYGTFQFELLRKLLITLNITDLEILNSKVQQPVASVMCKFDSKGWISTITLYKLVASSS